MLSPATRLVRARAPKAKANLSRMRSSCRLRRYRRSDIAPFLHRRRDLRFQRVPIRNIINSWQNPKREASSLRSRSGVGRLDRGFTGEQRLPDVDPGDHPWNEASAKHPRLLVDGISCLLLRRVRGGLLFGGWTWWTMKRMDWLPRHTSTVTYSLRSHEVDPTPHSVL